MPPALREASLLAVELVVEAAERLLLVPELSLEVSSIPVIVEEVRI